MSDIIKEQLSTYLDGELPREEAQLLVRRLLQDPELQARWARYHTIGAALRRQAPGRVTPELTRKVMAAIRSEAPARGHARMPAWMKPLAGVAIAASVAAVAVFGARSLYVPESVVPVAQVAQAPGVITSDAGLPGRPTPRMGTRWERTQPAVASQLNDYLLRHYGRSGAAMPAASGYARIVGYDAAEE